MFGVQKTNVYGTFGEFTVGAPGNRLKAQYLLTKMRPGADGAWENELATQMMPWREVFRVEELTFDELVQRDLDDSRVAHDLIPYLLDSPDRARFFPPILAVIAPKKTTGTGVEHLYPPMTSCNGKVSFQQLFDFEPLVWNGAATPLAQLSYNRQRTAFIIVDGQHRAMAVLALHRQLTDSWGNNPFASYYAHIRVEASQVSGLELPVCLVFFPDLHRENIPLQAKGVELSAVCRELFLAVNRHARPVSAARELLLDDEDISAKLMRQTLSKLKDRGEDRAHLARVYSFAYGDSDESGKQVMTGRFEFSSAVALHKLHCAISFGRPDAFQFSSFIDVSDLRNARNPVRPTELLLGTSQEHHPSLSRHYGKILLPEEVKEILSLLGQLADTVILGLFDEFRPLAIHNEQMRRLRTELNDPSLRSDPVQQKCFTLLFEGSGARAVFESHHERLKITQKEAIEEGRTVSDYVRNQISYCDAVLSALSRHEQVFRRRRAASLLGLDYEAIFGEGAGDEQAKTADEISRSIYVTVSTQAFQLGFVMAAMTAAQQLTPTACTYTERLEIVRFVAQMYIRALNLYFSPRSEALKRTVTKGLAAEPRIRVFDGQSIGLRGLLAMSVVELNERQWEFFRYALLEMIHSKYSDAALAVVFDAPANSPAASYLNALPDILKGILKWRNDYIERAVESALKSRDYRQERDLKEATARGAGKSQEQIRELISEFEQQTRRQTQDKARSNIKGSLGQVEGDVSRIIDRMKAAAAQVQAHEAADD